MYRMPDYFPNSRSRCTTSTTFMDCGSVYSGAHTSGMSTASGCMCTYSDPFVNMSSVPPASANFRSIL
eukprot:8071721-Pyramimonas_sp.AAC.1